MVGIIGTLRVRKARIGGASPCIMNFEIAEINVPGIQLSLAVRLQPCSRLQAAYDAWHAEREVDVSKIPTLEQA
jgi:hypothetical protein